MKAALDRADGDRIGNKKRLGSGLDCEQSGESKAHAHWLSKRYANRCVPPFRV
jgi:hypothetical protein